MIEFFGQPEPGSPRPFSRAVRAGGLARLVQVTMLVTGPADYAACNAEYMKHVPGGRPEGGGRDMRS